MDWVAGNPLDWVATFPWIAWQHSSGLGGRNPWNTQTEDLEGFVLVEAEEDGAAEEAEAHSRASSAWDARVDEIARLISSVNLEEEMKELVCDGIVEYTTRLLAAVELLRKTRLPS